MGRHAKPWGVWPKPQFNEQEWALISQLTNVHDGTQCIGERTCVIHNPTRHPMRDWTLHWRGDRKIFERICQHGVGHPDPDQEFWWEQSKQEWQWVHGCCGCC